MKSKMLKKTAAFILALTILGGGVPSLTGGTSLVKPGISAQAVYDSVEVTKGAYFHIGDKLDFGSGSVVYFDQGDASGSADISGTMKVTGASYEIDELGPDLCYVMAGDFPIALNTCYYDIDEWIADGWVESDAWGFVVTGDGTEENPYQFAPVKYAPGKVIPEVGRIIRWGERVDNIRDKNKWYPYYLSFDLNNWDEEDKGYIDFDRLDGDTVKFYISEYDDDKNEWEIISTNGTNVAGWLTPPAERHLEEPIGVKIVSGTGLKTTDPVTGKEVIDPFRFELVYEGDTIDPEEVTVGKKWYLGDHIKTDAFFNVEYISKDEGFSYSTNKYYYKIEKENSICRFKYNTILPSPEQNNEFVDNSMYCEGSDVGYNSSEKHEYNWLNLNKVLMGHYVHDYGFLDWKNLSFEGKAEDFLGIQVVGGSGTKDAPFTLAPIKKNSGRSVVLDEETGVLTLSGNVSADEMLELILEGHRVTSVVAKEGTILPENCTSLFSDLSDVTVIDLSKADMSKVKNTASMFWDDEKLKTIYLGEGFDIANVTESHNMFKGCKSLKGGYGTVYDSEKVDCTYARVDIPGAPGYFTTKTASLSTNGTLTLKGNVRKSDVLAYSEIAAVKRIVCEPGTVLPENCDELFLLFTAESIDLSNADASKVKSMRHMFFSCRELASITFGNFDTSNVTNMKWMFYDCHILQYLDISSFDTSKVTNMFEMFKYDYMLKTIIVSDKWTTSAVTNSTDMFTEDFKLVGGNGTKFDDDKKDKTYARIDKPGQPGYFTMKTATKITAQPADYSGAIGSTAKFTVKATGDGLTYQWQYLKGSEWVNSNVTGSKTNTLSVGVTEGRNGLKYRCVVKESSGQEVASNAATLKVLTKITKQPVDASGAIGDTVKFTVTATGAGLKYQWQYDNGSGWMNSNVTGSKTNTLSVGVTEGRNGLKYRCVVKDSSGQEVASNAATLKVLIKITKQPVDASGAIGDTVKFTVTATGAGLTYQWQYLKGSEWVKSGLTGAKTATLSVPVTEARNGLKYRCVIKDANGKTMNTNVAALKVATKITKQPADASGYIGDTVKFTATATGAGLTYQWQYDNGSGWMNSNVTGSKTNTLSVGVTEGRNSLKYRCVIKDANGKTVNSNAATLKVLTKITKQPADASGCVGDTVKFNVTATGAGLTYQWQYDNGSGWMNSNVTGCKTNTLSVYVTEARNGIKYRCVIKDANGKTVNSNAATLKVTSKITKQPVSVSGAVGSTVNFQVTATGVGLTYQWQYLKGSDWLNSGLTGAKTATLSVPVTEARNGLKYRCIIKDANGKTLTTATATLTVK